MSQLSADVEKMNSFYDKIITAHDLLLKNGKHNVIRMLSGRKDGEERNFYYEKLIIRHAKRLLSSPKIAEAFRRVFDKWKAVFLCVPLSPAVLMKNEFWILDDDKKLAFFAELDALMSTTICSQAVHNTLIRSREVINTVRLNSRKLLKKYIDSEAKARDSATELSDCDGDSGGSGGKEEGEVNKLKKQLAEARGQVQALSAQVQLLSAELQELKGTARDAAAEMCTMRGIRNPPSSQNCFLNTCLQAFWQIRLFRDGLLNLPTHRHDSRADENACLQCALFDFIYAYKFGKTAPLDPSRVRHALALRSKSRFAERQTADAYEALTALLEALHSAAQGRIRDDAPIMEPCLPLCLVHEIFWFVFLCPPPPTRSHARITFVSLCVL